MFGGQAKIFFAILLGFLLGVAVTAGVAYYYLSQILIPEPDWEAIFQENSADQETQTVEEQSVEPLSDYSNPFEDVVTEDEVSDEQYINPFDLFSE